MRAVHSRMESAPLPVPSPIVIPDEEDDVPVAAAPAAIVLSRDQQEAVDILPNGTENVFLTGVAGSGKSLVLRHGVEALRAKHGRDAVVVTASTGVAAANIGGITLHSFAAVGRCDHPITLAEALKNMKFPTRKTWQRTAVLIVDEISMIAEWFLTLLEAVGRSVRTRADAPMGGMRVIAVGDFLQLPPVHKNGDPVRFAFDGAGWRALKLRVVRLTQHHRQED